METGYEAPKINAEQAPMPPTPETLPPQANPENNTLTTPEQAHPVFEKEPVTQPGSSGQSNDDTAVDDNSATDDHIANDDTSTLLASLPDVASDDDRIEKEWVNKAKQILSETASDPYRREEAISALQREYVRKRYGKEANLAN